MTMTRESLIELRDLRIDTDIGTYGPTEVVPDAHLLDLTLRISPDLVQISADEMRRVFDYDPLVEQICQIAQAQHYETQEYLMTKIAVACAAYPAIMAVDICLRKRPLRNGSGSLGVRLILGGKDMAALRG
jgi:dihydroneopterin aldolase